MNDRDFALRPEASPLPYEALIECQRNAFGKILAALDEARLQIGTQSEGRRMSRIFFVSGEPGSGKSSLYFTLREILSREESDFRETYKGHYDKVGTLAPCIRWLELIDLEVTGEEGENLLAAVLVRIFGALDNRHGPGSTVCQEAKDQLEVLANDIGIAWDGNLKARALKLDPDSYSQEVMSAQRARLRINERLREALDKLSNGKCYGFTPETLFVLPVDDFYLKPAVSLELLRLLRMISVPRLFFLIMGDEKTMQALFLEKALADWTAIAGSQVFGALTKRQQEVLSRAREMSRRYFRKLLPPSQRADMNGMSWIEALRYKPLVETASSDVLELWKVLEKITILSTPPSKKTNLLKFLFTARTRNRLISRSNGAGFESNGSHMVKQLEEPYSALPILEAGPREILDLWKSIHQLVKGQELVKRQGFTGDKTPEYLAQILDIVLRAIEEQDFLPEEQQEVLRSAFPTGYDAGPVTADKFEFKTEDREFAEIPPGSSNLLVRKHSQWRIHIADTGTYKKKRKRKGNDAFSYLPPRQTAWIILLHDLSVGWDSERSITENLVHKVCKPLLQESRDEKPGPECPGWVWEQQEGKEEGTTTWKHLRVPQFYTFRQLDRFLAIWNRGLSNQASNQLTENYVRRLWNRAGRVAPRPEQ